MHHRVGHATGECAPQATAAVGRDRDHVRVQAPCHRGDAGDRVVERFHGDVHREALLTKLGRFGLEVVLGGPKGVGQLICPHGEEVAGQPGPTVDYVSEGDVSATRLGEIGRGVEDRCRELRSVEGHEDVLEAGHVDGDGTTGGRMKYEEGELGEMKQRVGDTAEPHALRAGAAVRGHEDEVGSHAGGVGRDPFGDRAVQQNRIDRQFVTEPRLDAREVLLFLGAIVPVVLREIETFLVELRV